MDDLAGLSFSSSSSQSKPSATPLASNVNYYPTLKPTPPTSGRSTPNPQGKPGSNAASKSATPANDSFANLVPFGSSQPTKQVSLQEQQRALQEQRAKNLGFQTAEWTGGSSNAGLGSGGSTPVRTMSPALSGPPMQKAASAKSGLAPGTKSTAISNHYNVQKPLAGTKSVGVKEDKDDILAAFNSSAPVDRSSHFPPPDSRSLSKSPALSGNDGFANLDDDDPFGLGTGPTKTLPPQQVNGGGDDDDDVLGLLGKPVSELPKRPKPSAEVPTNVEDPRDKAVAELVDMGFSAEKAAQALDTTENGTDVQAAVGWLLNQAHAESSGKTSRGPRDSPLGLEGRSSSRSRPDARRTPGNDEERDLGNNVTDFSSNFFKTANSLWKTGQKRFNKAVADFNSEGDQSQPKWMRDTQSALAEEIPPRRLKRQEAEPPPTKSAPPSDLVDMTDEAMMLEGDGGRQKPRSQPHAPRSSTKAPLPEARLSAQPARPNRRLVEEESAQAYVSPARRRKAAPKPMEAEPDLFSGGSGAPDAIARKPAAPPRPIPQARKRAPTPPRPKAPPRTIPSMSKIALQSSTSHRLKGNEAFKLGNYGDATKAYSNSLRDIPDKHPLSILLLTNRALTNLKNGDPKAAIADADHAIDVIGISRGQDEVIDVGGDEGSKPMAPFWGKAMMRRAEALEQLERWSDAGKAWGECVQAGVGGSQSIQARNRCEKALAPKSTPTPKPKPPAKKPAAKSISRSAMDDLSGRAAPVAHSGVAVSRLRAANAAAEKADDEKFALADSVDARLTQWRKGKEGNLRALLGSLDTVLWEGAGWKKVGMSELIAPNKVKIAYMKGIGKVHPDKLPPGASTEQVMISGAVFSTLNEAWDRFKAENGL